MKNLVVKFEKYIRENEGKRRRAIQKYQMEVKLKEQKSREYEMLLIMLEEVKKRWVLWLSPFKSVLWCYLRGAFQWKMTIYDCNVLISSSRHQYLKRKLESYRIYEIYLNKVIDILPSGKDGAFHKWFTLFQVCSLYLCRRLKNITKSFFWFVITFTLLLHWKRTTTCGVQFFYQ